MFSQALNDDDNTSMFGFSPRASPAVPLRLQKPSEDYRNHNTNWDYFYPNPLHHNQVLSPPLSAVTSLESWPYGQYSQRQLMGPYDTRSTDHPDQTIAQYGPITPPDDRDSDQFRFDEPSLQAPQQRDQTLESPQSGKRKRTMTDDKEFTKTSKRVRKSAGRPRSSVKANPSYRLSEDDRRSKFLERNRVAASKCRQKKKEWTSNLESNARELQQGKSHMALIVNSLKDEVMFLKGEMLKHTSCGCERIRGYLDRETDNITKNTQHTFWSSRSRDHLSSTDSGSPDERDDAEASSSANSRRSSHDLNFSVGERKLLSPQHRFNSNEAFETMLANCLA